MDVVMVGNPRSGRGRASRLIRELAGWVAGEGHRVKVLDIGKPDPENRNTTFDPARFRGAGALVVAGGDGTVFSVADLAVRTGTPLYHVPTGNENLFAREFGHRRGVEPLLEALRQNKVGRVDVGTFIHRLPRNGTATPNTDADPSVEADPDSALVGDDPHLARRFLLMCSLGPDASVIRRLAGARSRAVGHAAYVVPTTVEVVKPHFPVVTVRVDGNVVVDQRQGMAIVANCRQYALRIDPATRARMDDGTLDVVFFPCSTILRGVAWFLGRRARVNLKDPDSVYATGQQIQIEVHGADVPFQIDGEAPGGPGLDHASTLELGVEKGLLPVLLPA